MTEGMLTRTSYITTLASKAIRGFFAGCGRQPRIVSVPGRVTAELRKQWNVLGCLAAIDPRILDERGNLRLKSEVRGITHMHHAVDAITLGLAATLLPCDGTLWAIMCKRRVTQGEGDILRSLGVFHLTAQNEPRLVDIPEFLRRSIVDALAEQRVVVHQSSERAGLKVQQNVWGVVDVKDGLVYIRQRERDLKTGSIKVKTDTIPAEKAFGLNPPGGHGKLKRIKGVLLPDVNFGVALTNPPQMIRFHKVWPTLSEIGGGKVPEIIRKGDLIEVAGGTYQGLWRVMSVKDTKNIGIALDLLSPFATKVENKVEYSKINAKLQTMIKGGLRVIRPSYTGVPSCPITSLTSRATDPSSR